MRPRVLYALFVLASAVSLTAQTNLSFELFRDTSSPVYGGFALTQADVNGDGKPDLIYGGGTSFASVSYRPGNGDGTFGAVVPIGQTEYGHIDEVVAADLDRDGKLDVVSMSTTGPVDVFFGNGDGTFTAPVAIAVSNARSIAVGDFDGDSNHFLDIAVGDQGGNVSIFNNVSSRAFILHNTIAVEAGKQILNVRAGNFDDDGITNLAVLSAAGAYVLWNDGYGTFTKESLTGFTSPQGLNVGDLNQDGKADILISYDCHPDPQNPGPKGTTSDCQGILVFYGQGQRKTFERLATYNENISAASQVWAADINGDGIGDLVAGTKTTSSQIGMFAWLGHPDGSFDQNPTQFISTTNVALVSGLTPGDYNRDGMIDFAQVVYTTNGTQLYLNASGRAPCATSQINPTVTVCQPVDNTYVAGRSLHLQATSYDTNQVTAMQLYTNGYLEYSQPVSSIDQSFSLGLGYYYLVVKAWDYTGLSFRSVRHVNLYNGTPGAVCEADPGAASICVFPRTSNASPLHILANGSSAALPTAAQLYIDGNLVVNDRGCDNTGFCPGGSSAVDTYQALTPGTHDLVFKLWDANGNVFTASRSVNY